MNRPNTAAKLPSPGQGVAFYVVLVALLFLLVQLIVALLAWADPSFVVNSQSGFALTTAIQETLTVLLTVGAIRLGRFSPRQTLKLNGYRRWGVYAWGCVAIILVGFFAAYLMSLVMSVWPALQPGPTQIELEQLSHIGNPWLFALFAIIVSLMPAVAEELTFRGFVLTSMRTRWGKSASVVIAALLFALLHLEPVRIIEAFFPGLLLGYLVVRTGSLFPAIVAHAANNLWSTVASAAAGVQGSAAATSGPSNGTDILFVIGALALLALALYALQQLTEGDGSNQMGPLQGDIP